MIGNEVVKQILYDSLDGISRSIESGDGWTILYRAIHHTMNRDIYGDPVWIMIVAQKQITTEERANDSI